MYTETSCNKIPMIVTFWFLRSEKTVWVKITKELPGNAHFKILRHAAEQ